MILIFQKENSFQQLVVSADNGRPLMELQQSIEAAKGGKWKLHQALKHGDAFSLVIIPNVFNLINERACDGE